MIWMMLGRRRSTLREGGFCGTLAAEAWPHNRQASATTTAARMMQDGSAVRTSARMRSGCMRHFSR
jgi:hypothetical protein